MSVTREKKKRLLGDLAATLGEAQAAIFTDFRGVDVAGMTALRARLRAEGARYVVAKKTLAKLALTETPAEVREKLLAGSTGIAVTRDEPVAAARVLVDFVKEYEQFIIKGGLLAGAFIAGDRIAALAETPPREVLLARLLGACNAPATRFVGVCAAVVRKMLGTLQAIADKKEKEQGVSQRGGAATAGTESA